MKILIIGASRGTGALAAAVALERGHEVTALARNPERLQLQHPKLRRIAGSFHDEACVHGAVALHDAVIVTASATTLKEFKQSPNYFSEGTRHVMAAMKTHAVRRLVVLSALGVGDSRVLMGFVLRKLLIDYLLRALYADHERQEELVRSSGLEWVIARPSRLTNGPARGHSLRQTEVLPVPSSMSRADLASFLVEAAETDEFVRKVVHLGG